MIVVEHDPLGIDTCGHRHDSRDRPIGGSGRDTGFSRLTKLSTLGVDRSGSWRQQHLVKLQIDRPAKRRLQLRAKIGTALRSGTRGDDDRPDQQRVSVEVYFKLGDAGVFSESLRERVADLVGDEGFASDLFERNRERHGHRNEHREQQYRLGPALPAR
jgi:hypothetical protein